MGLFVVERYAPALSPSVLAEAGRAIAASAGATYLGSLLVIADEGALCVFDGPSREAIEHAARMRHLPCARVVEATFVVPTCPSDPKSAEDLPCRSSAPLPSS